VDILRGQFKTEIFSNTNGSLQRIFAARCSRETKYQKKCCVGGWRLTPENDRVVFGDGSGVLEVALKVLIFRM
jgi:hypothetical protein